MAQNTNTTEEKKHHFLYSGHAVGLSGHITLPFDQLIEAQAPCALAPTGGRSSSRVENFRFHDIVSFQSATTSVTGSYSEKDDAFFTVVTCTIEKLDILGVVSADKIVGRIMGRHPYVDPKSKRPITVEPEIVPLGCCFEKLSIAGHEVQAGMNVGVLSDLAKYSDLRAKGPGLLKKAVHYMDKNDPKGAIHCTLIDQLQFGSAPELKVSDDRRNTIVISQFGTIRLAEFVASPYARRVTMLNVRLGCGTEGTITASSPDGNGSIGVPP